MASANRLPLSVCWLLAARLRAWRVVGVTIWPAPRTRSVAKRSVRKTVSSSACSFAHSAKESSARTPTAGRAAFGTRRLAGPSRRTRRQRATSMAPAHAPGPAPYAVTSSSSRSPTGASPDAPAAAGSDAGSASRSTVHSIAGNQPLPATSLSASLARSPFLSFDKRAT